MARLAVVTTGHAWGDPRVFERNVATCLGWGLDVEVFVPLAEPPERRGWSADPRLQLRPLPVPRGRLGRAWLAWRTLAQVQAHGPYQLVHFHDPELVPPMAVLAVLHPRTYVLYDVHEDLPLQLKARDYLPAWIRWPLIHLVEWMLHLAAGLFSGFAPATEAIAEQWPGPRTRIIHNYPKAVFGSAGQQGRPPDPNRVLYVGGLEAGRGILVALEALRLARRSRPALRLELIGPVMEPEVGAAVAAAVAEGWCRHLPWLAPAALAEHAAGAGIGLATLLPQPSYLQSLPTKLFEYMAMGIPVLASDFPLWRQLVADAGAGRVVVPEVAPVAAAILEMTADQAGLRAWARAGRQAYLSRYRWERESRNLQWHLAQAGLACAPSPLEANP